MKWIKENRGTTMVEVMVAFAVLVLIMGIFSQALSLTGRMLGRASDTMEVNHQLAGDYYLETVEADLDKTEALKFTVEKGEGGKEDTFTIPGRVRRFTKGYAALYDVVPETTSAP